MRPSGWTTVAIGTTSAVSATACAHDAPNADRSRFTPKPIIGRDHPAVITPAVPLKQRYRSFDHYLAHLRKGAAIDKPWYREVRPGIYRLETSNRGDPQSGERLITRAELMLELGFTE